MLLFISAGLLTSQNWNCKGGRIKFLYYHSKICMIFQFEVEYWSLNIFIVMKSIVFGVNKKIICSDAHTHMQIRTHTSARHSI